MDLLDTCLITIPKLYYIDFNDICSWDVLVALEFRRCITDIYTLPECMRKSVMDQVDCFITSTKYQSVMDITADLDIPLGTLLWSFINKLYLSKSIYQPKIIKRPCIITCDYHWATYPSMEQSRLKGKARLESRIY